MYYIKSILWIAALLIAAGAATAQTQTWQCGYPNASDVTATLTDDGVLTIRPSKSGVKIGRRAWGFQAKKVKTVVIHNGIIEIAFGNRS